MVSEVAQLQNNRRKIIVGNLVGFIVWQLPYLVHFFTFNPDKTMMLPGLGSIISIIGSLVWAYYLIRLLSFSRLLRKKRKLAHSLNDEYIQLIRLKSFALGFWVLTGMNAILFAISLFALLNVQFVLLASIFAGVITFLVSYLIFEKDNE